VGQGGKAVSAIHYAETKYGFDYGSAKITRCFSDDKKGWITILVETPKHKGGNALQIFVTKSGKVRINGIEIKP